MELGFGYIKLKDGGFLILEDKIINKWQDMYKNVDVINTIIKLGEKKSFSKLSYKGALKLINKTLKDQNEKL